MADPSTNYGWDLPDVGGDSGAWGTLLNEILANGANNIDAVLKAVSDVADAALPKAGGTMTGEVQLKTAVADRVDLGSGGGTKTMDFDVANAWNVTVNSDTTLALANVPAGTLLVGGILRIQDGGSAVVTWPTEFRWAGGSAPTLTTSGFDLIVFVSLSGGARFEAVAHLNFS